MHLYSIFLPNFPYVLLSDKIKTPGIGEPQRMLEWMILTLLLFTKEKTSFENNLDANGFTIIFSHLE